ncbi:hypothetical protein A8C75_17610 [Marinobacterium aestuarii]|uniref:DUF2986 domain-containing protein n=1 Tax=Marinobacterium aestuarii TaxID=1821621 RepID=A0A1A9F2J7_9GAMM|nr:DUF2986 domain-containing protein [Marinobacterium aestuarii]ANG64108.1 hypothetical protein A8C75_17610 [Marinobacterium aestuarii]
MNRRKKINQILGKKAKKANLRENPSHHRPRYISKAEREKAQAAEAAALAEVSQDTGAENGAEDAGTEEGTAKGAGAEG